MLTITVTGTRQRPTEAQVEQLFGLLEPAQIGKVRHGDCVGVDETAHRLALGIGKFIVVHPPEHPAYRSWCGIKHGLSTFEGQVLVEDADAYIRRNHTMVDHSHETYVVPSGFTEQMRGSGTWATLRYTRRLRHPGVIIFPDGSLERFAGRE